MDRRPTAARLVRALLTTTFAALVLSGCGPGGSSAGNSNAAEATSSSTAAPDQEGERRAHAAGAALIGKPGPAFSLTTIDGRKIDLAAFYGRRPVYLKFWATWCIPCRQQMPKFERIFEAQGKQIEVIAINTGFGDDAARARAYRREHGLKMPIVVDDGRLAAALNLQVTPQHVVIGRDGRILYVGNLDVAELDRALAAAIAQPSTAAGAAQAAATSDRALRLGEDVRATLPAAVRNTVGTGTPTLLLFLSTWCETYVAESRPAMARACTRARKQADALAGARGVHVAGIAGGPWSTNPKDVTDYSAQYHPRFPIALDDRGKAFRAFGIRTVPAFVLVDGEGRLQRVLRADENPAALFPQTR